MERPRDLGAIYIRPARLGDLLQLHRIIQQAYREPTNSGWTTEAHLVKGERISMQELEQILTEQKDLLLVATCTRDTDVGMSGADTSGDTGGDTSTTANTSISIAASSIAPPATTTATCSPPSGGGERGNFSFGRLRSHVV